MTFRVASAGFALLFAFGAFVQWNDPDPLRWMAVYTAAAALSAAAVQGRMFVAPTALLLVVSVVWGVLWAPAFRYSSLAALQSFDMSNLQEEEVREAWGLVLLATWSAVLLFFALRQRQRRHQEP